MAEPAGRSALDILRSASWRCASCDETHRGIFALACMAPSAWPHAEIREPNGALRLDGDFLSEDFCVLRGEHFFVRCSFDIPVRGLAEKFSFGLWSTLSRDNFDIYVGGFDHGNYANMGPWFGWLSNDLTPFRDTLNQQCRVYPQRDRQRPVLRMADSDHPLAEAEEEGIAPEHLIAIYGHYGHAPA